MKGGKKGALAAEAARAAAARSRRSTYRGEVGAGIRKTPPCPQHRHHEISRQSLWPHRSRNSRNRRETSSPPPTLQSLRRRTCGNLRHAPSTFETKSRANPSGPTASAYSQKGRETSIACRSPARLLARTRHRPHAATATLPSEIAATISPRRRHAARRLATLFQAFNIRPEIERDRAAEMSLTRKLRRRRWAAWAVRTEIARRRECRRRVD